MQHPAAGVVVGLGGLEAGKHEFIQGREQRLCTLAQIRRLGRPVVHFGVDVARVLAIPRRIEPVVPDALEIGWLPAGQGSLYAIEDPQVRFAAFKKAEDRETVVMRLYNPTDREQKTNLRFAAKIARAWLTDLNEERQSELRSADPHTVSVPLAPQKIVTVEIEPG